MSSSSPSLIQLPNTYFPLYNWQTAPQDRWVPSTVCGSSGKVFDYPGEDPFSLVCLRFVHYYWSRVGKYSHSPLGQDLVGNTFWEFRDKLNAGRFRRILKPRPRTHYGDVEVSREFKPPSPNLWSKPNWVRFQLNGINGFDTFDQNPHQSKNNKTMSWDGKESCY